MEQLHEKESQTIREKARGGNTTGTPSHCGSSSKEEIRR